MPIPNRTIFVTSRKWSFIFIPCVLHDYATGWCAYTYYGHSLAFLESDEGKKAIIALHVDGIIDFINQRANEPL